mgnify:CR=1 FL=1
MKTIQFTGTEEQIEELDGRLFPKHDKLKSEIRVYVVNTGIWSFDEDPFTWEDDRFIDEAEMQGKIYTLENFQKAFNKKYIDSETEYVRFISVNI